VDVFTHVYLIHDAHEAAAAQDPIRIGMPRLNLDGVAGHKVPQST